MKNTFFNARAWLVATLALVFLLGAREANRYDTLVWSMVQPDPQVSFKQEAVSAYLARKYRKPREFTDTVVAAAWREAAAVGVSPLLLLAIMEKESSLRHDAQSRYGAIGLMQVVPRFHKDRLSADDPPEGLKDPRTNIRVGAQVLAQYLKQQKGDLTRALRKYSGNARQYPERVLRFKAKLREQIVLARKASDPGHVASSQ